jgi:hypothetical protein
MFAAGAADRPAKIAARTHRTANVNIVVVNMQRDDATPGRGRHARTTTPSALSATAARRALVAAEPVRTFVPIFADICPTSR